MAQGAAASGGNPFATAGFQQPATFTQPNPFAPASNPFAAPSNGASPFAPKPPANNPFATAGQQQPALGAPQPSAVFGSPQPTFGTPSAPMQGAPPMKTMFGGPAPNQAQNQGGPNGAHSQAPPAGPKGRQSKRRAGSPPQPGPTVANLFQHGQKAAAAQLANGGALRQPPQLGENLKPQFGTASGMKAKLAQLGANSENKGKRGRSPSDNTGKRGRSPSDNKGKRGVSPSDSEGNKFRTKTFGGRQAPPPKSQAPRRRSEGTDMYAQRIHEQMGRSNLTPPQWPSNPGDPKQRGVMDKFRLDYKKYSAAVRASLMEAGLIDDPDKPKKLADAIPFKGICEDMCPELEKITRIVEHDVKREERSMAPDGLTAWADPEIMVKQLARSAAGQDAPLPTEVRSVPALRRTLDYLIDDLLRSDANLPVLHNFLWDRTRAIRRDFVFHSTMSDEELKDQVYCLENITRFHVTTLHLLSQKGLAGEDFSERQEIEQLGKSLLSLKEAYDDCRSQGVRCDNEAEFRAYYVLFNTDTPNILETVQEWDRRFWDESDDVRTAVSLVEAMQNVWTPHGPIKPAPNVVAMNAFSAYFSIVESKKVSYTMACFAEIHFNHIRRGILRTMVAAYSRVRDKPKDLTLSAVNKFLRFDSDDEARDFVERHGLEFVAAAPEPYLLVDSAQRVESSSSRQSFSQSLVERKRGGQSLPELIHSTIYEAQASRAHDEGLDSQEELFVSQRVRDQAPGGLQNNPFASSTLPKLPTANTAPGSSNPLFSKQPASPEKAWTNPFGTPSQPAGAAPSNPFVAAAKPAAPAANPFSFPSPGNKQQAPPAQANGVPGGAKQTTAQPTTTPGIQLVPPTPPSSVMEAQSAPYAAPKPDDGRLAIPPTTKKRTAPSPATHHVAEAAFPGASSLDKSGLKLSAATGKDAPAKSPAPAAAPTPPVPKPASSFPPRNAATTSTAAPAPTASSITRTFQAPKPAVAAARPGPRPEQDLLGGLTCWYVLGDQGLLDDFRDAMVEKLVHEAFAAFSRAESEREAREAAARDAAEAERFRTYSLRVRYFYRWRDAARDSRLRRRAREDREKLRAYQDELRAARQKGRDDADRTVAQMVATADQRRRPRADSLEEALLATGVLEGVRDSRSMAAHIVRGLDHDDDHDGAVRPPPPNRKKAANQPATRGTRPPPRDGGVKLQMLRQHFGVSGPVVAAFSSSANGNGTTTNNDNHRRSLPAAAVPVVPFEQRWSGSPPPRRAPQASIVRRLTPGGGIAKPSSTPGRRPTVANNVRTDYFRLKARGLVMMPDGTALHESLANPMLYEGKRFPGLGNFGLPAPDDNQPQQQQQQQQQQQRNGAWGKAPAKRADDDAVSERSFDVGPETAFRNSRPRRLTAASPSPQSAAAAAAAAKRKRAEEEDEEEGARTGENGKTTTHDRLPPPPPPAGGGRGSDDDAAQDATAEAGADTAAAPDRKRQLVWTGEEAALMRELREMKDQLAEGREWYREQTDRISRGGSEWSGRG